MKNTIDDIFTGVIDGRYEGFSGVPQMSEANDKWGEAWERLSDYCGWDDERYDKLHDIIMSAVFAEDKHWFATGFALGQKMLMDAMAFGQKTEGAK